MMDLEEWIGDSLEKSYYAIKNAYEEAYGAGSWKKIDVPEEVEESEAKPEKLPFGSKTKLSPVEKHRYTEAKRKLAGKLGMPKEGWGLYGRSIVGALKNKEKKEEEKGEKSMPYPEEDEKLEKFLFGKKGGEGSRGGKVVGHDSHGKPIYAREGGAHGMTRSGKEVHSEPGHLDKFGSASDKFHDETKKWKWHEHSDAAEVHEALADHHTKDKKKQMMHKQLAFAHRQASERKENEEKRQTGKRLASEPSKQRMADTKAKWERHNKELMGKSMIADDGKPGKSLKETSTEELKATLAKLKPTDPGAEARIKAIKGELASRGGGDMEKAKQPSESTSLTPEKARQMLHERSGGHGRPITEQQRKFFGAVGGHLPAPGSKAKKSMGYEDLDDFLEKAATPIGGITPGGYKRIKKDQYVKVTKEEHAAHTAKEKERAAAFDPFKALMDPEYGKQMDEWIEEGKEADKPINASVQLKTMLDQGVDTKEIVGVMQDVPRGSILRIQYHPDDPTLTVRKVGSGGQFGDHWQIDTTRLSPEVRSLYTDKLKSSHEIVSVLKTFSEKSKVRAGPRPIPEPTKKSMGDVMSLEDYMEKAGPYIGKRGGKWADPEHKIPWKEEGGKKPSGGKEKKLNAKQANALRAAAKFGVVPGGAHATFSMVNKLADAGLLESSKENPQVYKPTEAGKQALASGSYKPAPKTKGGEGVTIKPGMEGKTVKPASMAGPGGPEGVKVKPGMEGKTVKPAGEAAPKAGGGLPEPKISKIGNATIRTYGDVGMIRSQPKLGHTVLDAEGTEIGDVGRHKSLAAAEKYLTSMKKSMERPMSLEDWMQKSGGLPTHQQGMGHKKSGTQGASADGGELADTGRTSGSSDSAPGPEQDSQGQLKGVSPGGKQKLSDDDAEEGKQMTEHKKPIETIKKSRFPADQRESVAHQQAAQVSQLQKSEDVYIGPDRHPYSHQMTHASGDVEASELVKSEDFYHGGSPQTAPQRPIIEQGVLCKSVNMAGCGVVYSAALTSCPECGAGTVGHRHIPGGPVVGAETTILEKSIGPGPLLRRPPQEPDVQIG